MQVLNTTSFSFITLKLQCSQRVFYFKDEAHLRHDLDPARVSEPCSYSVDMHRSHQKLRPKDNLRQRLVPPNCLLDSQGVLDGSRPDILCADLPVYSASTDGVMV